MRILTTWDIPGALLGRTVERVQTDGSQGVHHGVVSILWVTLNEDRLHRSISVLREMIWDICRRSVQFAFGSPRWLAHLSPAKWKAEGNGQS